MKDSIIEVYKAALKKIVQVMGVHSRATKIAIDALNEGKRVEGSDRAEKQTSRPDEETDSD